MRGDLITAIRSLTASSTFAAVALAVIALGIGAATALYSIVDPSCCADCRSTNTTGSWLCSNMKPTHQTPFGGGSITPQTYLDCRAQQPSFEGLAATSSAVFRLRSETGEPADARAMRLTHEFFPALRIPPHLGRLLTPGR